MTSQLITDRDRKQVLTAGILLLWACHSVYGNPQTVV